MLLRFTKKKKKNICRNLNKRIVLLLILHWCLP